MRAINLRMAASFGDDFHGRSATKQGAASVASPLTITSSVPFDLLTITFATASAACPSCIHRSGGQVLGGEFVGGSE